MKIHPIRIVEAELLGEEVPRPHSKKAHDLTTLGGERWVAKSHATIKLHGLRAEAVSTLVAQVLGVPTPVGAVCDMAGYRWWCSELLQPSHPWENGHKLTNSAACASIVLLDLLIHNEDRHRDNLLIHRQSGGRRVVAIDHEQAWIGYPGALSLGTPVYLEKYPETFVQHPSIQRNLLSLAEAATLIPAEVWLEVGHLTASVVPETNGTLLGNALIRRAKTLPTLANSFFREHRRKSMTIVTYSSDPTWHPRFVLAVVEKGQVICRPQPLKKTELGAVVFQRDAAELLGELRQLQSGADVPGWVRWRGLCVGLEEVPQQPVERLFLQPLPARMVRAA